MPDQLITEKRILREELLNTISHGLGAIAAVFGFILLLIYSAYTNNDWALFSALFYGISLMSVYISSTLYHAVSDLSLKRTFRKFDHACIYLLIAGTYTPLLLMTIGGPWGWTLFGIQWGLALFGILMKILYFDDFNKFSLLLYAAMGWIAIFKLHDLYLALPYTAFILILAGGIIYTVGIFFFILDGRLPYAHFIWHMFVIGGSLLHYFAIFLFVI
jgi:hemolysin III